MLARYFMRLPLPNAPSSTAWSVKPAITGRARAIASASPLTNATARRVRTKSVALLLGDRKRAHLQHDLSGACGGKQPADDLVQRLLVGKTGDDDIGTRGKLGHGCRRLPADLGEFLTRAPAIAAHGEARRNQIGRELPTEPAETDAADARLGGIVCAVR
jgi:hypothetical protein